MTKCINEMDLVRHAEIKQGVRAPIRIAYGRKNLAGFFVCVTVSPKSGCW